jgi:hypothetical protein
LKQGVPLGRNFFSVKWLYAKKEMGYKKYGDFTAKSAKTKAQSLQSS